MEDVLYHNATEEKSTSVEVFGVNLKYIAIGVLVIGAAYVGYKYWKKRQ
jgi:predicted negative regulator of RcsB-dependent stress response